MGTFVTSGSVYFLGKYHHNPANNNVHQTRTTRDKASRQTEYGVHFMLQHHHQDKQHMDTQCWMRPYTVPLQQNRSGLDVHEHVGLPLRGGQLEAEPNQPGHNG